MSDIKKTHKVFVGIGSNIEPILHINQCLTALKNCFNVIKLSPVYETSSMGFSGPNFYNLAVYFETTLDVISLKTKLNEIEELNGRRADEVKFSSRTLDIDILYYDDLIDDSRNIPRSEIIKFDFVLRPLYDLEPGFIHPITKKTHYSMLSDTRYQKMIIKKINFRFK